VRVAVTGTPGTGKTTAVESLSTDLDVVHLTEVIESEGLTAGRDESRDTLVADIEALAAHLSDREDVVFESHLAHHLPADRVVVLRCHPEELTARLAERGASEAKRTENADSEALDVILAEAVDRHDERSVYEIDTTDRSPEAVAAAIEAVVAGERDPSAGTVDFVDYV
jgi:adenylate kinase